MRPRRAFAALMVAAAAQSLAAAEIELLRVPTGDIGVLLRVDGTLGGRPMRWLVDSGATANLVAPHVDAQPVQPGETLRLSSAAGGLPATRVRLTDLHLGDLAIASLDAWRADLAPVLGALAAQVDGVLGLPFLDGRRIAIDLRRQRIDFDALPTAATEGIAIERDHGLPVLAVQLQGRTHKLLLDTGAAGGIARLQRGVDRGVRLAPLVQVAGIARRQVPVADLPGSAIGRALPSDIDGTMGMALLDGCRFTLDLAEGRFVLRDCASEAVPGGFGLQWTVVDGRLTLAQVWPDSPARRAGLRAGDRVLRLGDAAAPADVGAADALLAGQPRIAIEVERGAQRVAATLERAYFLPPLR